MLRDTSKFSEIVSNGINIFKRVELATKCARIIPQLHANDVFYQILPKAILDAVKREKILRKDVKLEINAGKKKAQRKEIEDKMAAENKG